LTLFLGLNSIAKNHFTIPEFQSQYAVYTARNWDCMHQQYMTIT